MQLIGLLILALFSACTEVISIGAIIPFIAVIMDPKKLNQSFFGSEYIPLTSLSTNEIALAVTISFGLAACLAGILRLILLYTTIRLGNDIGAELSVNIFQKTLDQPYKVHLNRNSSEIISGIVQKTGVATSSVISTVTIISMTILFVFITSTLFLVEPIFSSITICGLGISYGIIMLKTKVKFLNNSNRIAKNQTSIVKSIQEGLGSIREILLTGSQANYIKHYRKSVKIVREANIQNVFMNQSQGIFLKHLH